MILCRGGWVAQWVVHGTSEQVMMSGFVSSSRASSSVLTVQSLLRILCLPVCVSLPPPPPHCSCSLSCSFSKINKLKKKRASHRSRWEEIVYSGYTPHCLLLKGKCQTTKYLEDTSIHWCIFLSSLTCFLLSVFALRLSQYLNLPLHFPHWLLIKLPSVLTVHHRTRHFSETGKNHSPYFCIPCLAHRLGARTF